MNVENFRQQCYLLARDEKKYLADGTFNQRTQAVIELLDGEEESVKQQALATLEEMITFGPAYAQADEEYRPVLIYKSEEICYGILNYFADRMAEALREQGILVEIFDCRIQPLEDLIGLSQKTYRAVLGIQTYFFSIQLDNGECLHDYFDAPKYIMQFDHPIAMHNHWLKAPKDLTVLIHDRNYQRFLDRYYGGRVQTVLFTPGGQECPAKDRTEKRYDLSFVGTHHSFMESVESVHQLNRVYKGLGRKLIRAMRRQPNRTYEDCFDEVYESLEMKLSKEEKLKLIFDAKLSYYVVMFYYREKIIRYLLEEGIELHVFGASWKQPAWRGYENLIVHPEVSVEESLKVYAQSKLSLNIMSWHKDGMTERIANAMLNHSVVVTDRSTYLMQTYENGGEMLLFDLEDYKDLPDRIRALLADENELTQIADRAYAHAKEEDTWSKKAEEFINIIDQRSPAV